MLSTARTNQQGQIALIVLLISAVLLTVGINVSMQSIVATKISRQETESSQTFGVAEKVVEQALGGLETYSHNTPIPFSDSNYSGTFQISDKTTFDTQPLALGQTAEIKLTGATYLTLTWTDDCDFNHSAIIIAIIHGNDQSSVTRYAYGDSCGDNFIDTFTYPTSCENGICTVEISLPTEPYLARVKAVYHGTNLTVAGNNLPLQAYQIDTKITKNSGEKRAVQAVRPLKSLPGIFDYALFSGTSIAK